MEQLNDNSLKIIESIREWGILDEVDSMKTLILEIIDNLEEVEREQLLDKSLIEDIIRGFLTYNLEVRLIHDSLSSILQTVKSSKNQIFIDSIKDIQRDISFYHEFTDWLDEVLSILDDDKISNNEYVIATRRSMYDLMIGHENSLIPLIETFDNIEI